MTAAPPGSPKHGRPEHESPEHESPEHESPEHESPEHESPDGRIESVGWLELFFDLVVVASVGVMTAGLREELTWTRVGLTAVTYTAVWLAWSSAVLYANVAKEDVRVRTMSIAMFLVALMAASAPLHGDSRANVFAVAFLVLRIVLARSSLRTGRVLGSWPLLQFGGFALPWLVSVWVAAPAKYWVWAAALAIDLVMVVVRASKDPASDQAYVDAMTERTARRPHRPEGRGRQAADASAGHRAPRDPIAYVPVDVDRSHLDERLGLFVIIVLGESVIQLVHSAATRDWTSSFESVAIAGFFLLFGLWRATFSHGFTGAPHVSLADLPPRFGLPLHLVSTLGLVLLAAGLGDLVARPDAGVTVGIGWLVCGGLALHFGVAAVAGLSGRASWKWLGLVAGACTAYVVVLGSFAPHLSVDGFAWLAAVPAVWQGLSGRGWFRRVLE